MSRREDILARMLEIIAGIDGVETSARNLDRIVDLRTPYAALFDGDEDVFENIRATGAAPNVVNMTPTIIVSLGDVPENIGTVTNSWLAKVQRAVLLDSDLQDLCGKVPNSGARYVGCLTSLQEGRTAEVNLSVLFSIAYAFQPSTL